MITESAPLAGEQPHDSGGSEGQSAGAGAAPDAPAADAAHAENRMKDESPPICARCRFWEFSYRPQNDFATGECRRHAPIPQSYVLARIAQLLGQIAWATEEDANIKHEKDGDYEGGGTNLYELNEWPITGSYQCCGEFEAREKPAPVNDSHPFDKARMEAAAVWEKEVGLSNDGPWVGTKFKEDF